MGKLEKRTMSSRGRAQAVRELKDLVNSAANPCSASHQRGGIGLILVD